MFNNNDNGLVTGTIHAYHPLFSVQALHQDVLSYQRVMDSITDKAQSLAQSSSDGQLAAFISQTGHRYQKLCSAAKVSLNYHSFNLTIN